MSNIDLDSGRDVHASTDASAPLTDSEIAMTLREGSATKNNSRLNPRAMHRMAFQETLMQDYLDARKEWELRRDSMIEDAQKQAANDPQAMERLTRALAHASAMEEAKLSAKYADAVIRGHNPNLRELKGHLDIKSTTESLQDAKDSFRGSALSSEYTASKVYPVALQPNDWFEALDTGLNREELSRDPDLVSAAVKAKSQHIDALENQIASLGDLNTSDPSEVRKKMDDAARSWEVKVGKLTSADTAT